MEKGDVVTVLTISGEFVGKLKEDNDSVVVLEDPRMLVQNEQGMGFANGVALTGKNNPSEVAFRSVVFMVKTNDDVESAWRQAVTGIIV
jgi:hypothetical protein